MFFWALPWERPLANIQSSSLYRLHVCNFHTGILACLVDNIIINFSHRSLRTFRFFHFSKLFFCIFFFHFTMVIKRSRELRGESAAYGDRSASSMSKYSAGVNSEVGNGSLWVKIHDAEHVDQCRWRSTRVWSHQLTSDLNYVYFFGNARIVMYESSFGACRASRTTCFL